MAVLYFMGDYRGCLFSILAWGSATNRRMAKFLFEHKAVLSSMTAETLMALLEADAAGCQLSDRFADSSALGRL